MDFLLNAASLKQAIMMGKHDPRTASGSEGAQTGFREKLYCLRECRQRELGGHE